MAKSLCLASLDTLLAFTISVATFFVLRNINKTTQQYFVTFD